MQKNQKGITLIALVITIIVLLILAGVTIAMLTGTDSAPVKANEAKQKQDIGAAKDQVMIYSQEYQTLAYDLIYVKGLPRSGTAANGGTQTPGATAKIGEIGTIVGDCVKAADNAAVKTALTTAEQSSLSTKDALKGKTVGLATITTNGSAIDEKSTENGDTASAWIKITTTDFKTYGYIKADGGALVWLSEGIISNT